MAREGWRRAATWTGWREGRPHTHIFLFPILLVLPHTLGPSSHGGIKKKKESETRIKKKKEKVRLKTSRNTLHSEKLRL